MTGSKASIAPEPAVVVGAQLNGLGVVRSLPKGGMPIIVIGKSLQHAAIWSRWSTRHIVSQLFGQPLVDTLLKLHAELGGRPVLILTDELSVNTVSEHRETLGPHYRFRLPSPAMVDTLSNKAAVQRFAQAHDLPVPRTVIVERERDLTEVPVLGMPVIIKPADKEPVHLGLVGRVFLAATMREVTATCQQLLKIAGPLVVQEWIDGPDSNIYFTLFHCGATPKTRSIFCGRKLAARPRRIGSTAVCVPAPEAADKLGPLTERFLDVSEYEGLGSLEFKRDPRTQRFIIIEPTVGRTDSQEEIAALNGLNLPLIAYRYELGLPPPEEPLHNTAAWRESFLHIGRSSGLRSYDGYWRTDDPLPALAFATEVASRSAARLLSPLLARGRPPIAWEPVPKQARH
jgi:D-aspartate ligase